MVKLTKAIIRKYGITKKAWAVARGSSSSRKARHHSKGGKISMARRRARRYFSSARRRGRSGFSLNTAFKFIRLGALAAPGIYEATADPNQSIADKIIAALGCYGGWNQGTKQFDWSKAVWAWSPFLAATLMTKGISKLSGIIRKI